VREDDRLCSPIGCGVEREGERERDARTATRKGGCRLEGWTTKNERWLARLSTKEAFLLMIPQNGALFVCPSAWAEAQRGGHVSRLSLSAMYPPGDPPRAGGSPRLGGLPRHEQRSDISSSCEQTGRWVDYLLCTCQGRNDRSRVHAPDRQLVAFPSWCERICRESSGSSVVPCDTWHPVGLQLRRMYPLRPPTDALHMLFLSPPPPRRWARRQAQSSSVRLQCIDTSIAQHNGIKAVVYREHAEHPLSTRPNGLIPPGGGGPYGRRSQGMIDSCSSSIPSSFTRRVAHLQLRKSP